MGEDGLRVSRIGLVGVGAWGRRYLETIGRRDDCRVVAFARASAGTADDAVPGARRCSTWGDLLGMATAGDIDGVIVATTPASQAEVTAAAITAGVPVLVEKPLGLSAATARDILTTFRAAPRKPPVVVDYIHLWAPAYRALKAIVGHTTTAAGSITALDSEGCNRGPFRSWSSLYDYGPHDLAMCLDLIGAQAVFRLLDVSRNVSASDAGGEIFEAHLTLGDVPVRIRVGNGSSVKVRRLAVSLNEGRRLVYDDLKRHPGKLSQDDQLVPVDEASPLDAVLSHFLGSVAGWRRTGVADPAGVSLELSVKIGEILDAIKDGAA